MIYNEALKFFENTDELQNDFDWYEFTLEELNLPSVSKILEGVKTIEKKVHLQSWRTKHFTSNTYKGFGITYNPTFFDKSENIYHQVFGSKLLSQNHSSNIDAGDHKQMKDTYYDGLGFRKIDDVIKKHLGFFLDRFNFHIVRSRVAYLFGYNQIPYNENDGWHIDEPTCQILRVNIPLQTSEEYVIQFKNKTYVLETGKAYLWNTRLDHRAAFLKIPKTKEPRINIVLGLTPWLNYDKNTDTYNKSKYFGKSIKEIVEEKLFVK
jgi:hypothetical protein